jgi:hypothetical protein
VIDADAMTALKRYFGVTLAGDTQAADKSFQSLIEEVKSLKTTTAAQSDQLSKLVISSEMTAKILDNNSAGGGAMLVEISNKSVPVTPAATGFNVTMLNASMPVTIATLPSVAVSSMPTTNVNVINGVDISTMPTVNINDATPIRTAIWGSGGNNTASVSSTGRLAVVTGV